jgi:hypothetical protein
MKKEIIKSFDLAKAKAGAKLRTKNGCPVEIFKWDARGMFPIKGMIKEEKQDLTACWDLEGSWRNNGISHKFDLVIVEEVEEPDTIKIAKTDNDTVVIAGLNNLQYDVINDLITSWNIVNYPSNEET